MKKRTRILNIDIDNLTVSNLLEQFTDGILFTPNIDHLVKLQNNREFYNSYLYADHIVCDSRILQLCSKFLDSPILETIPGSSFFQEFYNYHAGNPDIRIFLLGAEKGVGEEAKNRINRKCKREIIVGTYSPPFHFEEKKEENDEAIQRINECNPTVLIVGLGAPRQENWIIANRERLPGIKIIMGLGATIDFEAGKIRRAPAVWQKTRMEWFYRFLKEPKRLFRRYFIDDPKFFIYFFKQLTGRYRNPFDPATSHTTIENKSTK